MLLALKCPKNCLDKFPIDWTGDGKALSFDLPEEVQKQTANADQEEAMNDEEMGDAADEDDESQDDEEDE